MKSQHLSAFFQWCIIVVTLIFVGTALYDHWQEVKSLDLDRQALLYIFAALSISLLSHCWSGILWGEILSDLQYPVSWRWALVIFLRTEIAKYLPGDVWQVYGRLMAAHQLRIPVTVGIASIVLQSVYIAAAGIAFGLLAVSDPILQVLWGLGLATLLISIHPTAFNRILNLVERLSRMLLVQRLFTRLSQHLWNRPRLRYYPWSVLAGQCLFLALRSISFLWVVAVFTPVSGRAIAPLAGGFALAWALGIVSPISGGVGVFEATAVSVLDDVVEPSIVLGAVILYRLIALLTEAIGSVLGWAIGRSSHV
jgi:uncharacterized membrane protein YbhN (UPF0104 family)